MFSLPMLMAEYLQCLLFLHFFPTLFYVIWGLCSVPPPICFPGCFQARYSLFPEQDDLWPDSCVIGQLPVQTFVMQLENQTAGSKNMMWRQHCWYFPAVNWLQNSSLTNPEGFLIPAAQGHSKGVGSVSGSSCSCFSWLLLSPIAFALNSCVFAIASCACSQINASTPQGWVLCGTGSWGFFFLLHDLEEAETLSAFLCNMSHSVGHSQVIQYHFLSSPCANRQGWRGTISGTVGGGGHFCVSRLLGNYVHGQTAGIRGENKWGWL